jgi:hypothetical protein
MKVKLDDCKDFNESGQYNKHITYKLKQTYNRCKGSPYIQSSNFEKNNAKINQLFSPTTYFKNAILVLLGSLVNKIPSNKL